MYFRALNLNVSQVPTIDSESLEGRCPEGIKGEITFKDVEFSYPSREEVKVCMDEILLHAIRYNNSSLYFNCRCCVE